MKTLTVILVILGLVVAVMFAMGKAYHYEKSVVINAPAEKVYANVNSTKAFNAWNPWMKLDPNLRGNYSGKQGEIGDKFCWDGNDEAGSGCQEVTLLIPNKKQSTKMTFYKPFESVATSDVVLSPQGKSTKVTWSLDCDIDYPMNLMKLFMDYQMSTSFTDGLSKLKLISEK